MDCYERRSQAIRAILAALADFEAVAP